MISPIATIIFSAVLFQPQAENTAPDSGVVIWPHGVSTQGVKHKDDFGNHALSITVHDTSGIAEVHGATADATLPRGNCGSNNLRPTS